MKTLMSKIAFCASLVIAVQFGTAQAAKKCEVCEQIQGMNQRYEEDEPKAYEEFNKLLSQVKLSKDKAIRKMELSAIVKTSVLMDKSDDRAEIPQYLFSIGKENPAEFKQALKDVKPEARKKIMADISRVKRIFEKGEEP